MHETEVLMRFLRYTAGLPALCWDGTAQMLEEIEREHCFFRRAQPYLTAKGLQTVFSCLQPGVLYEIEDVLGIHAFFFLFQEQPVFAGPFVAKGWSADGVAENKRLIDAGLAAGRLLPYQLYYCSHCCLDKSMSVQLVTGAVTALLPEIPPYTHQRYAQPPQHGLLPGDTQESFDYDSTVRQFELEKRFYKLILEGQTGSALEVWERMEHIPLAEEMAPFDLHRKIASLTGLRLLLRLLAEYSGVNPSVVYSTSVDYAQKIYTARSDRELRQITHAMIREFSDAIHAAHTSRYSPAVKTAVNYLKTHIDQKIETRQLAALAHCPPEYLSQRFKAETGKTVAQYLAGERCRIAADLLRQTDLPVQKISAHVGYPDSNYFVKIFKKHIGTVPTEYRGQFRL